MQFWFSCSFMGVTILWSSFVSKSTKIVLSYITPSLPLLLYLITFAKDTESNMAEDEQNSRIATFFHTFYIFLKEKQNTILDELLPLKIVSMLECLLVWQLNVDNCWFPLLNILNRHYKELSPHFFIPYP